MKVCHVCSGHTSSDSRVFHKECLSLVQAGYEVHLIATDTSSEVHSSKGVIVHPLPSPRTRLERLLRRWRIANIASRVSADLYHVHEPALLGPILSRVGNKPTVYDVHESFLGVLAESSWIPKMLRPLAVWGWDHMEQNLIKRCAAVVGATDHIATRYAAYHQRVIVLRNFTSLELENKESWASRRKDQACVFAGALMPNRNLGNTIAALGILRRRGVVVPLWLAGEWVSDTYQEEVLSLARSEGVWDQVTYFGILSYEDTIALEARASIGLVNILPCTNSLNSLPIKMFECMALGLPLVYSDFPVFQKYVGRNEAGISVDPTNTEQTANAIERLVRHPDLARRMGDAGRRTVTEECNWNKESSRLVELYRDILGGPDAGPIDVRRADEFSIQAI